VNTSGVANSFSWTPGNFNGIQNSGVPYLLWNFSTATQVTIAGSSTVPGTIYAPGATVNDNDQNGLNGSVIAAAYAQGGVSGSPSCGQVQYAPFAGTISSCSTPQLTISLTAGTTTAVPGGTVHYTVSVTNAGNAAYSAATFTDSLSGVLDDAIYNGDASASSGSVSYASPNLTWTGSLAVGGAATVTFSVTVNNPDSGDKSLVSTVTSATAGSNCPSGGTNTRCANTVTVLVPGLTIALTASTGAPSPGTVVTYTITAANSGQTAYTGAALTDSLSGLLDDASYGDATATAGSVTYSSPNLAWTGNLAVGATATITFSVTVNNPDTGDKLLATTVTSATAGSNCPAGSTDSRCTSSIQVLVPGLAISLSAGSATTTPGAKVQYTVTVTNTGGTAYAGAAFTDLLGDVLDDASYNGDATASAGSVSFASPNLSWTGNLAVGGVATITFSVTVSNPDTGNKILASTITSATPGSDCPAASCTATVNVAVLTIVNSAGVSTTTPGSVVRFTATFTNSGQVPYTGITIASNITDVLDDATSDGDQTATSGTLSLTATGISWTGSIPVGGTVTVTGTRPALCCHRPGHGRHAVHDRAHQRQPGHDGPGRQRQRQPGYRSGRRYRGFGADWTATVSATGFTTGNGTAPETIPASDAFYDVTGFASTTGPANFSFVPDTNFSGDPQPVVSATNVDGDTSATWDPLIDVQVPVTAIGGQYTATIVHSVS
jgi:uncharacterized repeat protein (TIGR01451 family)